MEKGCGLQFPDHLQRLLVVDRRKTKGHVAQQFDIHATRAQHHDDTQCRVPACAEDTLHAATDHRGQQHAVHTRRGRRRRYRGHDPVIGGADLVRRADIQGHAADVALVGDVGREHLHGQRYAERPRDRNRILTRACALDRRDGDAETLQHLQRIGLVVRPRPQRHWLLRRLRRRCRPLKSVMEITHGGQDADGAGRIGKAQTSRCFEGSLLGGVGQRAEHHQTSGKFTAQIPRQLLLEVLHGGGAAERGEEDEQAAVAGRAQHRAGSHFEQAGIGRHLTGHVDGIASGGKWHAHPDEILGGGWQTRDFEPHLLGIVGHHDTDTAGDGQKTDPLVGRKTAHR